jgi:membrane-associated phospholipid phosphatase
VAANNDRARAVAFDAIVSSVIASKAITPALKELTGRERPNGGDASFPSNHATQAFAVASVIAGHYPEKRWVGWLAYGLANGVAFSRVYHDAHYTSDVLAGAAIGALVGRTVVTTNRRERATWTVTPARNGIVVSARW